MRIQGIDGVLIPLPNGVFLRSCIPSRDGLVGSQGPNDYDLVTRFFVHYGNNDEVEITEAEFDRLAALAGVGSEASEDAALIFRELFEVSLNFSEHMVRRMRERGYAIMRTEAK